MDRARLHRIRTTFDLVAPCGPAFIARILDGVSVRHHAVSAVCQRADSARFNTTVWMALDKIIRHIGTFRTLETPLIALGIQLARGGLRTQHVPVLRQEFLRTMAELVGTDWNSQVRQDWQLVLEAVGGALLRGVVQEPLALTSRAP